MSDAERPAVRLAVVLTGVQCLATLGWAVYAALLPGLLAAAGIPPGAKPWVLLGDQLVFGACDLAAGLWLDRAGASVRRFGGALLAAVSVATAAFLAMPRVATGEAAAPLLLASIAVWAVASSALRAPLPRLLARHASLPDRPALGAFLAAGAGLGGACLPTAFALLGAEGVRTSFAVSGLTLWLLVALLAAAERGAGAAREEQPSRVADGGAGRVVAATFLAALAVQLVTSFAAQAALRRHAAVRDARDAAAVFGVAMALSVLPSLATRALGAARTAAAASAVGALAAAGVALAPSAGAAVLAVGASGVAWGVALTASLAAVTERAPAGRAARWTGAWYAAQAAATGARMLAALALGRVDATAACAAAALAWALAAGLWPRARVA